MIVEPQKFEAAAKDSETKHAEKLKLTGAESFSLRQLISDVHQQVIQMKLAEAAVELHRESASAMSKDVNAFIKEVADERGLNLDMFRVNANLTAFEPFDKKAAQAAAIARNKEAAQQLKKAAESIPAEVPPAESTQQEAAK